MRRHRLDDTVAKALAPMLRADVIVVDDIGLLPVTEEAAEGLYRLVDAAYERRSMAISSNLHPSGFDRAHAAEPRHRPGRPPAAPCPRGPDLRRVDPPPRRHQRQGGEASDQVTRVRGWGIPWPYLGRLVAIPGEFRWPPVGRNRCPLTVCTDSINFWAIANPTAREPGPWSPWSEDARWRRWTRSDWLF